MRLIGSYQEMANIRYEDFLYNLENKSWATDAICYGFIIGEEDFFDEEIEKEFNLFIHEKLERPEVKITRVGNTLITDSTKGIISGINDLRRYYNEEFADKLLPAMNSFESIPSLVSINDGVEPGKHIVPTVILYPDQLVKAYLPASKRVLSDNVIPFSFRNMETMLYMPNYPQDIDSFRFAVTNPDISCIVPPFLITKNIHGIGNTVICMANEYSNASMEGVKHINEALTEKVFWDKVILSLATMELEVIKSIDFTPSPELKMESLLFSLYMKEKDNIKVLAAEKANLDRTIEDYIKDITSCKINRDELERRITSKEKELSERYKKGSFLQEIKLLKQLPYLEDIEIISPSIYFITKPIQIDDGPYLGGYSIQYNMQTKDLRIENTENPKSYGELAHPHIPQNGHPCFGNYTDIFYLFETNQFYFGMELLHTFLATYNPEDEWGRRLIFWDAEYAFEDIKERGLLSYVERSYNDYYYDIYNEYLPSMDICSECGLPMDECECDICQYCGRNTDVCTCWICPECGCEVGNDCMCERCEVCGELLDDCGCDRCDICDGLIDPRNMYSNGCTCERCPKDYDLFIDEECEECDDTTCEYHPNYRSQEEALF